MQAVVTFEHLTAKFSEYCALFYTLPIATIPRPTKAKKLMGEAEKALHDGWNKHICKICNQSCLGGAGSGWTNLLNHLRQSHPIGGIHRSWRDFLIEN